MLFGKQSGSFYFRVGRADLGSRRFKEAKEAYIKAIDLDPKLAAAHMGLGYVLSAMGEREAAVERLHEVRKNFLVASHRLRVASNCTGSSKITSRSTRCRTAPHSIRRRSILYQTIGLTWNLLFSWFEP